MYCHTTNFNWFSNLSLLFFEPSLRFDWRFIGFKENINQSMFLIYKYRSSMTAELIEKLKIRPINGSTSYIKVINSYWKLLQTNQNDQIL